MTCMTDLPITNPLRVFIHEYISGGGFAGRPLPPTLLAEGAAMLRALLADFRAWGVHRLLTTRDARLPTCGLPADEIVAVEPGCYPEAFSRLLASSDAALVIAPESGGLLAGLSGEIERAGLLNFGSTSEAVRIAGDKLLTVERLAAANLPVPPTVNAPDPQAAKAVGLPLVLKPRDGVGCVGLRFVADESQLITAWQQAQAESEGRPLIAQPFVGGVDASVSLLCDGQDALAISLNGQDIAFVEGRLAYGGGTVPLDHPLRDRAMRLAETACRLIPGLRGYAGVDLLLAAGGPVIMEINPRLTTSYVGLRRVVEGNLAAAICAAAQGKLPGEPLPLSGRVRFSPDGAVADLPFSEFSLT
jgi:predicted ATP-grasp superfamily ATP-dependent carboligase